MLLVNGSWIIDFVVDIFKTQHRSLFTWYPPFRSWKSPRGCHVSWMIFFYKKLYPLFSKTFQNGQNDVSEVRYADRKLAIRMNDELSEELSLLIPPVFDQQFHRLWTGFPQVNSWKTLEHCRGPSKWNVWTLRTQTCDFLFFWNSIHRKCCKECTIIQYESYYTIFKFIDFNDTTFRIFFWCTVSHLRW